MVKGDMRPEAVRWSFRTPKQRACPARTGWKQPKPVVPAEADACGADERGAASAPVARPMVRAVTAKVSIAVRAAAVRRTLRLGRWRWITRDPEGISLHCIKPPCGLRRFEAFRKGQT